MKQLHTFDEVYDSQKVFRKILDVMANPGRVCDIQEESDKLFGEHKEFLALSMTLLDNSVSFATFGDRELDEQIILLTHARPEEPSKADFLFLYDQGQVEEAIRTAKCGTLENPHSSATILYKIQEEEAKRMAALSGPGVDGILEEPLCGQIVEAVKIRDGQGYEYPAGIDFLFLLPRGRLIGIPRLTKMEET